MELLHQCAAGHFGTEMVSTLNGLDSVVVVLHVFDAKRVKGTARGGEGGTIAMPVSFGEGVLEERVFTCRTEAGRLLSRRPSRRGDALRAQPDTDGALLQAIVTLSDRLPVPPDAFERTSDPSTSTPIP